jgi:hypothetical protein
MLRYQSPKMRSKMKHLLVSFVAIVIGLSFTVLAQTEAESEVYIEQVQHESGMTTLEIHKGTIELPDHPLIRSFVDLNQMLMTSRSGLGSIAYGLQEGSGNLMEIRQSGYGHVALSWQHGNDNVHTINQDGSYTAAAGIQIGDGNILAQSLNGSYLAGMAIQLGDGNRIEQDLTGMDRAEFRIQQEGNFNALYQIETGISVPYQVRQWGNGLELIIIDGPMVQ